MAIALDATAQSGQATDFQTVFSFNHVLGGGSLRAVVVGIAGRQGGSGSAAPTPTYNGVNMTQVQAQGWSTVSGFCAGLWIIKEASLPAAGTYAVAVTIADSDQMSYGIVASSWTGVDQATTTQNPTGAAGADATPTLTVTSAANNLVLTANMLNGDPATTTLVCDGTERVRNTVTTPDTHDRCIMQTKPGAASVVMAPTQAGNSSWVESGVSIIADAGGVGNPKVMFLH